MRDRRAGAGRPRRQPWLAVGAVAAVVWGWGVAQNPYLLPQKLTIADAAAASATLTTILIIFGVAVVLVLPSIGLLFTLVQRNVVEETSQPAPPPADAGEGAPAGSTR
jgi:cytochrome d ubiquinol oxidase subunit II